MIALLRRFSPVLLILCAAALQLPTASAQISVTTGSLPDATMLAAYRATLSAFGGTQPYTWSLASGSSLPPGLSLAPTGVISGTPTQMGGYSFVVNVSDSTPAALNGPFTGSGFVFLTVDPVPGVLPPGELNW